MILKALSVVLFAAAAAANNANPKVVAPYNLTYTAGDVMDIKWADSTTGFLNIDVSNMYSDVLQFPMMIAAGVPAEAGKYTWKIPSQLKTAAGYQVRVWGSHQPTGAGDGTSQSFTILNMIPNAVNTFTVLSPNKDKPCTIGTTCQITWDFPEGANHPAMVDIGLYRVGNPTPIMPIATVSSSLKSYSWAVPNDPALMAGDVYISVSGEGMPVAGPGMANDMGGNSHAFAIAQQPPATPADKEDKKTEKKTAPKKTKPQPENKVAGASKKEKSAAASAITTGELVRAAAVMAGVAALVPLALAL